MKLILKNALKTIYIISAIFFIFINFQVSTAEPNNLLSNPGFEIGADVPLNWTFITINNNTPITSNISHSGSRSIKISILGTADGQSGYPASEVIPVRSDTTYTFTAWGRTENANGTNLPALRLVELDANNNSINQADLIVFSRGTNDWEQRTGEFYTGPDTSFLYIYASIFNGFGNFWLDDLTINLKENFIANPGFESGALFPFNWTFFTINNNTPILSNISHSGSRSVEIRIPGTTDGQSGYPASDVIQAKSNTTYTFTVWGRTENANGSNPPVVRIAELDNQMNLFNLIDVPFVRGSNDWEQRLIDFQTGTNTAYLYIYAAIWNGYGTFWMDDTSIGYKTNSTSPQIPAPSPSPTPAPTSSPVPAPSPSPANSATIAYLGDARPSKFGTQGITELTKDFNQVVPQSPTGKVDAIFMIGDMDRISQTRQAYEASNVNNIPIFYVVGNHEVDTSGDVSAIRSFYSISKIPLSPGPAGTDKTTYSLNVGDIHVINSNQYWDGNNNGRCDWHSSGAKDVSDDACFKYSSSDGGYIPDALYNWMNADLSNTSSWKIVVGHEPLYPKSRHTGNSLDEDTENRDNLQKLFVDKKVSVFIGAHTHYAGVENVEGIYHVNAGVSGQKTEDEEDKFASIVYTYTTSPDELILTWKREDPTWSRTRTLTYTIKK